MAGRPYILHLNEPNLLVTRVSEYVATSGGDALSTQVLRQIYYSAVMVFGDSDLSTLAEIVPSTASTTMSFFSHLDESERELKRVRELLDDSRLVQQSISDRLQVYEPLDVERPSIFLSHSFDKHTMAQSNSFKRLLSELPLDVVNGPAEEIGLLSAQIVDRIRACSIFVALVDSSATPDVSEWILEEKGAALGLGKQVLLVCDHGVHSGFYSNLAGDSNVVFADGSDSDHWLSAFERAVEMIRISVGKP